MWSEFQDYDAAPMELTLYNAIDVILLFYSLKQLNPATYTVIQLLFYAVNVIIDMKNSKSRRYAILLCVIGAALSIFGATSTPIQYYSLLIGAISAYVSLKIRKLSATYKYTAKSEFSAALMASILLILTSADETSTFNVRLQYVKLFPFIVIINAIVLWRYKKADQTTSVTVDSASYILTAVTTALKYLVKYSLWLQLLSILIIAIAIYISRRTEALTKIDQQHVKEDTRSATEENKNMLYIKIGALIGIVWLILLGHVSMNNPDVKLWTANDTLATVQTHETDWNFNDKNMPEGVRKAYRMQCLHKTRAQIMNSVSRYFHPNKNFTILDFPNHWNLGDSFIYQGQTIMWMVYGQIPLRPPFPHTSLKELFKHDLNIEGGTIFLHGGGNFGDLYPATDNYRWKVLLAFRTYEIVMMPQSIYYVDDKRISMARANYNSHVKLTMMLRDYDSYDYARANFKKGNPIFAPDSAFMIGPSLPNIEPVVDILLLLRRDKESVMAKEIDNVPNMVAQHHLTSEVWDFPTGKFPDQVSQAGQVLWNYTTMFPDRVLPKEWHYPSTEGIVAYRTVLGNTLLSRGRVVVTDRLHASIMATLVDRPVVYIDNNYKKLTKVRSSLMERIPECTDHVLNAYFAPDLNEAIKIAVQLVQKLNKS
jgi:pyruvyl transferase EpsO